MCAHARSVEENQVDKAGKRLAKWWRDMLVLEEDELAQAVAVVQRWRAQHSHALSLVTPGLRNWIGAETILRPIPVAQRLKQLTTIVEKLGRHPAMSLPRMHDIAGCRGILPTAGAVDRVATRIRETWDVTDQDDYRTQGRPTTGYRALHVIVRKRERLVEIQLRTTEQHRWAEIVAATGERLGYPLKDGHGPSDLLEYFRLASDMLWAQEQDLGWNRNQRARFRELRQQVRPYFAPRD